VTSRCDASYTVQRFDQIRQRLHVIEIEEVRDQNFLRERIGELDGDDATARRKQIELDGNGLEEPLFAT